jgi:hypothetical protein
LIFPSAGDGITTATMALVLGMGRAGVEFVPDPVKNGV